MRIIEATDADFADLIETVTPRGLTIAEGGIEKREVLEMLRDLAAGIRPAFAPAAWLIVDGEEIVGLCSLVKPPADRGIDIGYGVAASRCGAGLASSGVGLVVDWARSDVRVDVVRAETSVDNRPSQRVLERNGFGKTGDRFDEEDGDLICWAIDVAT